MPILNNVKTVWVGDDAFDIPGTNLTIFTIKLEVDGERLIHKTMSDKIATEGWTGDVEVYTNDKGKEYVRQAPKENTFTPSAGKAWQPKDDKNITLGLVFKTFCTIEGMLPQKPEHWNYIKKATVKLIEIGNELKGKEEVVAEPAKVSGYEKAKQVAETIKQKTPIDDWGNMDIIESGEPINLNDIPF